MKEKEEIWKDIPGYEGRYQVSDIGRVKSLTYEFYTKTGKIATKNGKLRLASISKVGYPCVTLKINQIGRTYPIHVLVAISFLGHQPNGTTIVVNHKSGDKLDNRLSNLELVTHRDNTSVCHRNFKRPLYSEHPGVTFDKKDGTWKARIQLNKKNIHIGTFKTEINAANAYQNALSNYLKSKHEAKVYSSLV